MKRFLFLMVLFCMGILSGFAQEDNFTYTDGNGVTWGGYVGYDYETQKEEVCINTNFCFLRFIIIANIVSPCHAISIRIGEIIILRKSAQDTHTEQNH